MNVRTLGDAKPLAEPIFRLGNENSERRRQKRLAILKMLDNAVVETIFGDTLAAKNGAIAALRRSRDQIQNLIEDIEAIKTAEGADHD